MTTPATAGFYELGFIYDGHETFYSALLSKYFWWSAGDGAWCLSNAPGVKGAGWWDGDQAALAGTYTNGGTATGTPTVSADS